MYYYYLNIYIFYRCIPRNCCWIHYILYICTFYKYFSPLHFNITLLLSLKSIIYNIKMLYIYIYWNVSLFCGFVMVTPSWLYFISHHLLIYLQIILSAVAVRLSRSAPLQWMTKRLLPRLSAAVSPNLWAFITARGMISAQTRLWQRTEVQTEVN